jgi:hypothetical protein
VIVTGEWQTEQESYRASNAYESRDGASASSYAADDEREAIVRKWTNSIYKLHDQATGQVRKSLGWDLQPRQIYLL